MAAQIAAFKRITAKLESEKQAKLEIERHANDQPNETHESAQRTYEWQQMKERINSLESERQKIAQAWKMGYVAVDSEITTWKSIATGLTQALTGEKHKAQEVAGAAMHEALENGELRKLINALIVEGKRLKDEKDEAITGMQVQAKELEILKGASNQSGNATDAKIEQKATNDVMMSERAVGKMAHEKDLMQREIGALAEPELDLKKRQISAELWMHERQSMEDHIRALEKYQHRLQHGSSEFASMRQATEIKSNWVGKANSELVVDGAHTAADEAAPLRGFGQQWQDDYLSATAGY